MELFKLEQLSFQYPLGRELSLRGVNAQINEGDFILLCGSSGCGKTTLLRQLKREIAPAGKLEGNISYCGTPLRAIEKEMSAREIGFVFQNPDNQIVMDDVYSELAFGLENLQCSAEEIRQRIAELSSFFGMESFIGKRVEELSGGQKQILNLASVLLFHPRMLILDEPTSQLDPVAAKEFLGFLKRLNEEFGMTILLSEHRFDDIYPICSRVWFMQEGRICFDGVPKEAAGFLWQNAPLFVSTQGYISYSIKENVDGESEISLSVHGNQRLIETYQDRMPKIVRQTENPKQKAEYLGIKRLFAKYTLDGEYVLKDLSLSLQEGSCTCLLGANGSGKTTLLKTIAGLLKPQSGSMKIHGKKAGKQISLCYLPQNPLHYFSFDLAKDELDFVTKDEEKKLKIVEYLDLNGCLDRHPHDLSGGEQQRLMIACGVLGNSPFLLMDEPTKGMDLKMKDKMGHLLSALKKEGKVILMVSHDVDFAAEHADACCLMFDGGVASFADTVDFFAGNYFYTTNCNRIMRKVYPKMILRREVDSLWNDMRNEKKNEKHEKLES